MKIAHHRQRPRRKTNSAPPIPTTRRVVIDFPEPLFRETERAVAELSTSRSSLVRAAVEQYLEALRMKRLEEKTRRRIRGQRSHRSEGRGGVLRGRLRDFLNAGKMHQGRYPGHQPRPDSWHEIRRTRACLVVQNDIGDRSSPLTIVVPVGGAEHVAKLTPIHVFIPKGEAGLAKKTAWPCATRSAVWTRCVLARPAVTFHPPPWPRLTKR